MRDFISGTSSSPFDFIKEMLELKLRFIDDTIEAAMEKGTSQSSELLELREQKDRFELALKKHIGGDFTERISPHHIEKEDLPEEAPVKEKTPVPHVVSKLSQKPLDVEIKLKEIISDSKMSKIQRKILASMHGRARDMGFKDVREMLQFKRSRLLDSLLEMKKKESDDSVIHVVEKEIVAIDHLLEGNLEETLDEIERIEKIQKHEPEKRKELDQELSDLFKELK